VAAAKRVLLDDRLLLEHLLGGSSRELRQLVQRREVFTTGYWYYRLCQAIRSERVIGALSGPFHAAETSVREQAALALVRLPDEFGLLSLRELAPSMAEGVKRHRLNVMSVEALTAGVHLGADIALARGSENPTLIDAAGVEGVRVKIVEL
jgi:hypothetical protein